MSTQTIKHTEHGLFVDDQPGWEEGILEEGDVLMDDDAPYPDPNTADPVEAHLHPDDPNNFFKLSHFIKLVLAHSLTTADVDKAEDLIRSYCIQLSEVCHPAQAAVPISDIVAAVWS
jgi:hypothetical protein